MEKSGGLWSNILMSKRTIIYMRQQSGQTGTQEELNLAVESQGGVVIASYLDDGRITGRGKYAGWRKLVANLDGIDQIVVGSAGDLPGKAVNDFLKILGHPREQSVGLRLHREGIDTGTDSPLNILDLIAAYRSAKTSEAIKVGLKKAVERGTKIGRPEVPPVIRERIRAALAEGGGIRPTARRFKVSPAFVVNIRRTMVVPDMAAAW